MDLIATLCLHGCRTRDRLELSTTHVALLEERWGIEYRLSLPLHQVASISYYRRAPLFCLLLASLTGLLGGILAAHAWRLPDTSAPAAWFWTLAAYLGAATVVLLLIYWLWRGQFLELASPTERIEVRLHGQRPADVRRFIRLLETQQLNFMQGAVTARQIPWQPGQPPEPLPAAKDEAVAKAPGAAAAVPPAASEPSASGRPKLEVD